MTWSTKPRCVKPVKEIGQSWPGDIPAVENWRSRQTPCQPQRVSPGKETDLHTLVSPCFLFLQACKPIWGGGGHQLENHHHKHQNRHSTSIAPPSLWMFEILPNGVSTFVSCEIMRSLPARPLTILALPSELPYYPTPCSTPKFRTFSASSNRPNVAVMMKFFLLGTLRKFQIGISGDPRHLGVDQLSCSVNLSTWRRCA
jgi:hypothetical protein